VTNGLRDREGSVRVAAAKVVGAWFDGIISEVGGGGTIMSGILRFLQIFDVVGPGEGVAAEALLSVFVTRKYVVNEIVFEGVFFATSSYPCAHSDKLWIGVDSYWNELTPELVLLARVFVDHCLSTEDEARLDTASLPVVTAFAFHIQEAYNALLDLAEENTMLGVADQEEVDKEERDRAEDNLAKAEFVLCELLMVAVHLDYTDEIGRRKVSAVVREWPLYFSCMLHLVVTFEPRRYAEPGGTSGEFDRTLFGCYESRNTR
jgi:condensin complex subunit 3